MASNERVDEDLKRHVLQAFMSHRILKKNEFEDMCKQACRFLNINTHVQIVNLVEKCNKRLEPLGMKIQSGKMEQDGSEWIGLVNTREDEAAKRATHLSLAQLEYFKTVLQLISIEDDAVSSDILIRTVDSMERKITKKAAQDLLNELVADKWLHRERGCYSIGPRGIIELLPFLDEITGEQIDECHLCSTRVVMGQRCVECDKKLHLYCVARLARSRSVVKCPSCHAEWSRPVPS